MRSFFVVSSKEYNLKQSEDKIGQLYPVLLAKDGKIIDGLHRLNIDSQWKTETLEYIDTREKFLKARIISNLHRRTVPAQEIRAWLNELAELAFTEKGIKPGKISGWIADETGYSSITIRPYLDDKYKYTPSQEGGKKGSKIQKEAKKAMSSIAIEEAKKVLGSEKIELVKEALKEEVSKEIRKQVVADVKEEAKEELRRDPDFIIKTAETALKVLPHLPPKVTTPDGYHKPTLTLKQKEMLVKAAQKAEKKREERIKGPDSARLKEIGHYNRIFTGLLSISAILQRVECPITGNPAETDLIFKESGMTIRQAMELCDKKLMELRK